MKQTKKSGLALVAILALALVMVLSACGGGSDAGSDSGSGSASATDGSAASSSAAEEGSASADAGDAYALYETASKAMQESEGYEMDMRIELVMDMAGVSTPTDTSSHIAVNDPAGNMEMLMTQKTTVQEQDLETTMYVKDGAAYTEAMGQKMKIPMDAETLKAQSNNLITFMEDAIIDQSVKEVAEGKQVSFTIKGDAMSDYIKKQMQSAAGAAELEMTISDAKITAVVGKDGNLVDCTTEMSYTVNVAEQEVSASMVTEMANIKIGKVAIDVPKDLDSYQELGAELTTPTATSAE